jgi:hypothetical protein
VITDLREVLKVKEFWVLLLLFILHTTKNGVHQQSFS